MSVTDVDPALTLNDVELEVLSVSTPAISNGSPVVGHPRI